MKTIKLKYIKSSLDDTYYLMLDKRNTKVMEYTWYALVDDEFRLDPRSRIIHRADVEHSNLMLTNLFCFLSLHDIRIKVRSVDIQNRPIFKLIQNLTNNISELTSRKVIFNVS
jgi:hypothetical protein